MNKNGTLVILNDLKKKRKDIEVKYNVQKNKKFTDKQACLYALGFLGVFAVTCVVCPTNMYACASIFVGYGLGIPVTYAYCLFSKEEKLRKEINNVDKEIKKLELELVDINVKHQYDVEKKGMVLSNSRVKETVKYPISSNAASSP